MLVVTTRYRVAVLVAACCICWGTTEARASGHGPLFGAATPVLGKGGFSFDAALMGRGTDEAIAQSVRSMLGFGVTENIQVSVSLPFDIGTHPTLPGGRMMASMSSNRDVELQGAWRVHTRPLGVGGRFETTLIGGWTTPFGGTHHGRPAATALSMTAVSGIASRTHYVWLGAAYQRFFEEDDSRPGHVSSYTLVYGYRPPAWQVEYPKPDVRLFAEVVAEHIGHERLSGLELSDTGGTAVFVGPSVLALYKAYALEAGIQFPLYRNMGAWEPGERFRFGVNFAYFFWMK
jgi:hypothetical protein